ncbi:MAG TPA: hypothetical protein VE801_12890 [Xanthobacteraceae bacterium]|nr:hypothetical protein [Xanthobacteraceae bacterium]
MIAVRTGILALALALVAGATTARQAAADSPVWTEFKWPFPLDQWGTGRAFRCRSADCGADVELYLRAKIGFCNCTTGVTDDTEVDRVGDLELLSSTFNALGDGRPVTVGWMQGRSRRYRVATPYSSPRTALAIAFNDKCDVVVATVVSDDVAAAERTALGFLNGDPVLRWVEKELGL